MDVDGVPVMVRRQRFPVAGTAAVAKRSDGVTVVIADDRASDVDIRNAVRYQWACEHSCRTPPAPPGV